MKTHTMFAALAFTFLSAGALSAQAPATAQVPRPATPATELEAIERALAESQAKLAAAQLEQARALADAMTAQDFALAGHEAMAWAEEAALLGGSVFAFDWETARLDRESGQSQAQAREREEEARQRALEARERGRDRAEREADLYQSGYESLNEGQWERALDRFNRVIDLAGDYADRALYWKAYSQYKLGQGADALQTIGELQKAYAESRYLTDAQALAVEVRENAGQPADPDAEETEELKLLALRALQSSDPELAVPMLENLLRSNASPRLKQRALFVLAQSRSDQARQVLASVARGEHNPDLQLRALQYLGFNQSDENRALLGDIYAGSNDVDVKRRILRAYGAMKETDRLLQAAQSESSPELRSEAVRQLGVMKAHDALASLYQRETDIDVKQDILRSMFISGNVDFLLNLARTESNPDLKRSAVRNLGMMPKEKTGDALRTIYEGDNSIDIRKAAVMGLYIQKNDVALVELARKESNTELKKEIINRLSLMKSKVALDYLMEILNK